MYRAVKFRRTNKYKNKIIRYNGINFQSERECNRYKELLLLKRAKLIKDLELQKPFVLLEPYIKNGKKINGIKYYADFYYTDIKTGLPVVEDAKGVKTQVYIIKKKLFEFKYKDLEIREV